MINSEQLEKRVAAIRVNLEPRDTEDLLEIWQKNDRREWTDEAFIAIERILLERLGEVPSQTPHTHSIEPPEDSEIIPEARQSLKKATQYLVDEKFDKAFAACEDAIRTAPNYAPAYNLLGLIYDATGQVEDAVEAYREAVRLDPDFEEAQENLRDDEIELEETNDFDTGNQRLESAMAFVDDDEFEKALAECELAIQAAPHLAAAYNYRGMIYEELEQFEAAVASYQEAVRLYPEFYAARENLGNAKIKLLDAQYRQPAEPDLEILQQDDELRVAWENVNLSDDEEEEFLSEIPEDEFGILPAPYLDEKAYLLRGWPGHRTRPGRSGYDPLDTDFEWAHMQGVLIRYLLTGMITTRNPIYLLMMGVCGLILLVPAFLVAGAGYFPADLDAKIMFLITLTPYVALGLGFIVTVWISLWNWYNVDEESDLEWDD